MTSCTSEVGLCLLNQFELCISEYSGCLVNLLTSLDEIAEYNNIKQYDNSSSYTF